MREVVVPRRVVVKYLKTSEQSVFISGVFGGPNADGTMLSANFYVDRVDVPEEHIIEINPANNTIISQHQKPEIADSVREIVNIAVLNYTSACAVRDWFVQFCNKMEEQQTKLKAK